MGTRARLLAVVTLALAAAGLPALSRSDFDKAVDFTVGIKDLDRYVTGEKPLPERNPRFLLLEGTVSDIVILDKEEATFRVRVELLSGEWLGTEDVKGYACWVIFSGTEFSKLFPVKAPKTPGPNVVTVNTRLLVAASAREVTATALGEKRVVLEGLYYRIVR